MMFLYEDDNYTPDNRLNIAKIWAHMQAIGYLPGNDSEGKLQFHLSDVTYFRSPYVIMTPPRAESPIQTLVNTSSEEDEPSKKKKKRPDSPRPSGSKSTRGRPAGSRGGRTPAK